MPWFKVDDNFGGHPKVLRAGNNAVGLWVRCGSYCALYLTDGHIPLEIAREWGRPREIEALLAAGLWAPNGDGYVMPDYLDYNPSKAQVEAERAANRERQAKRRRGEDGKFD